MVRFGYGPFWLWDEKSSSLACLWSVVLSGDSNFFHHENWSPRYSWNIAESGVITHKKEFSSCWFWMSVDSFLMSSFILSQLAFIWILFAIMRSCYGIGTYDGMVWVDNMRLHRYVKFSHVTIVFIAKYPFTGSEKILNNIVFKIAIKFISMRNSEISNCLYSKKFK